MGLKDYKGIILQSQQVQGFYIYGKLKLFSLMNSKPSNNPDNW